MNFSEQFFGDKYDQLLAARPALEQAGLAVPSMVGIPQEFIDGQLAASSLPTIAEADTAQLDRYDIARGLRLEADAADYLQTMAAELTQTTGGGPLILRSSGRGDARGIGVYHSQIHGSAVASIRSAFESVVASYFDEHAVTYRRRAGHEPGFGMFMQAVAGKLHPAESNRQVGGDGQLFLADLSGNARIGTPRHPAGNMRLQFGYGSAVDVPGLAGFDFAEHREDNLEAAFETEQQLLSLSIRNHAGAAAVTGTVYVSEAPGVWRDSSASNWQTTDLLPANDITLGQIKEWLIDGHEALGAAQAHYFEFVLDVAAEHPLAIVQKADIPATGAGATNFDAVPKHQILIDTMVVEGGNGATPTFDTFVCLNDTDRGDLYAFDASEEAASGYLLAYSFDKVPTHRGLNLARLANVRAFATFETSDSGHGGHPAEHIVGYSDQLGIPLISISGYGNQDAWQIMTGFSWDNPMRGERRGNLTIQKGAFQVLTDAASSDGLIVRRAPNS